MDLPLFLILFTALGGLCLWIGSRAGKGNATHEDYFLAGRGLKIFPLAMTLLATQLGGGAMMGACDEAFLRGWSVLFYPLGMVAGLLLLGLGVGAKLQRLGLKTVAELFERKYGSIGLRRTASLLSIAALFFILMAQAIGARKFFISLGYSPDLLFTLFWFSVVIYTTSGGFKGVVLTDRIQALFILGALTVAAIAFFSIDRPALLPALPPTAAPSDFPPLSQLFSWLVAPLLFMLIEQDMGQRCFSATSARAISRASLIAAGLLFAATLVPIFFGAQAKALALSFGEGSSSLLGSVEALTNPWVSSIMALAIVMAIISTTDSLLNSISSNLVFDFPFFQKRSLRYSQVLTALLGILTYLISFHFESVLAVLIFSYQLSISLLFVPVLFALIFKEVSKKAALSAMITGAIGFVALRELPFFELIVLASSTAAFLLVSRTSSREKIPS